MKKENNNVVNFPSNLTSGEREVEAILFAAAEPLEISTIESKISKNINVKKILEKLQKLYSTCLLYTSPSPRDATLSRMPSSA